MRGTYIHVAETSYCLGFREIACLRVCHVSKWYVPSRIIKRHVPCFFVFLYL